MRNERGARFGGRPFAILVPAIAGGGSKGSHRDDIEDAKFVGNDLVSDHKEVGTALYYAENYDKAKEAVEPYVRLLSEVSEPPAYKLSAHEVR